MTTFNLRGLTLEYANYKYNHTRNNERAVEVALGLHLLASAKRTLEVGAVLPHYLPTWPVKVHDVVDLTERYPGVINANVLDYVPEGNYDLVLSISTLEHIGHIKRIRVAVDRMKNWLADSGLLFITLPCGYRPDIDILVHSGKLGMEVLRMDKVDQKDNLWVEWSSKDKPRPYSRSTKARALYLLFYKTGGLSGYFESWGGE